MDLRQAKKILDKINRLYDTMTMDEEEPDVFERDLMLSYIRQLYAAFDAGTDLIPEPPPPAAPASTRIHPPVVEEVQEIVVPPIPEEEELSVPEITVEPEPTPEPEPEPIAEVAPPPPTPAPEPVQEVKVVKERTAVSEVTPPSAALNTEEHEILFEHKEASELSEKLSQQPIKDIFKAMSINERILTLNELFGGNKQAFDQALDKLNGFNRFEEAKQFLTHEVAGQFDWLHPDKKKKAKNFIKLVRRRYK